MGRLRLPGSALCSFMASGRWLFTSCGHRVREPEDCTLCGAWARCVLSSLLHSRAALSGEESGQGQRARTVIQAPALTIACRV